MLFKGPLDKQFKNWGKHKQSLPVASAEMKERILQQIKTPVEHVSVVTPHRLVWGTLSGVLAVLVLFVGANFVKQKNLAQTNEQNVYGGCGGVECNLSASVVSGDVGIMYGAETGLSGSGSVVANTAERVSKVVSSLINPDASVPDAREFLQYAYQSDIKTRKVAEITGRLQTVVRGYGGRVDNISVQEKYGSIYFVVPKANLFAFQQEVKSLVKPRFYSESMQAQNLLPEKVSIEKSTDTASEMLVFWQAKLTAVTKTYNTSISNLQKQLNGTVGSINRLHREVTTSSIRQQEINKEISRLYGVQAGLQKKITIENENYSVEKRNVEERIKETQFQLDDLTVQDQKLQQEVETVEGSVQVEWVSVLDIIKIYSPHYWAWILVVCALALIFNYFSKRRVIEVESRN